MKLGPLSEVDQQRVASYLNEPAHRRERAPFKPWILLAVLIVVMTILTAASLWYAASHGIPLTR